MFWDTGYSNSENIDALLNKETCTLKELLEDEDILQECKSQNQKLVKFLNRTEILNELVELVSTEPTTDYPEEKRFLYPNVACEILTSDVPSLKQRLAEDPNLMNKLFSFFEQEPPVNPLLASFICKTFGVLIMKKMEQDWFLYQTICLHVLEFVKSKENFLDAITQHFAIPVVVDLLIVMLNDVEDMKMKNSFLEWINERDLIAKMIDVLQVPSESARHPSIAQFLIEIIKIGRCNRQNDTEDKKGLPNPLLQTLEDTRTVGLLLDVILSETRCESGILSAIQVLLCLLENPIIQEPVSQSALQQMIDAEKEHHDEIVESLMSIVQPRVHQLFELLLNPPAKFNSSTALGNVRLELCYLFTVLLETENALIIEEICKTNFFTELLKLFKQYCWNNFLHNYVKKCLIYGMQAFDTTPTDPRLVLSALQRHVVVDCKMADKLMDCWNENKCSQLNGGRRMGYMGHLIETLGAVQATVSASEEFRALIESSLSSTNAGEGDSSTLSSWREMLEENEIEVQSQNRLLADCDPQDRQEYGREVGFPSNTAEYDNDSEDYGYQFNSSIHGAVNGDFNDDFTNDDDAEAQDMFDKTCEERSASEWNNSDFADWNNAESLSVQQDYPFNNFNNALNVISTSSPFDNEAETNPDDAFVSSSNGFNSIIDNFADFDSHFADTAPIEFTVPATTKDDDEVEHPTETCFVATTQTVEITTAPAEAVKREFVLGTIAPSGELKIGVDELDEEEFYSLRDDSNDMSSLTDDIDKKMMENTEVPDDEDDDFASADESSSKGNSEEETGVDQFVDCAAVSPPPDAKNEHSLNGIDDDSEAHDAAVLSSSVQTELSSPPDPSEKLAKAPASELISPVVPVENGSA